MKFVNCHVQNISINVHEIYTLYYMYENYFTIPMSNAVSVTFQSQHTSSKRKFNAQKLIINWGAWEQLTWTFLYTAVKKINKSLKNDTLNWQYGGEGTKRYTSNFGSVTDAKI